jgi:hypothetical protein
VKSDDVGEAPGEAMLRERRRKAGARVGFREARQISASYHPYVSVGLETYGDRSENQYLPLGLEFKIRSTYDQCIGLGGAQGWQIRDSLSNSLKAGGSILNDQGNQKKTKPSY